MAAIDARLGAKEVAESSPDQSDIREHVDPVADRSARGGQV